MPLRLLRLLLLSLLNLLPPVLVLGRASLLSLLILLRRFFLSSVELVGLAPFFGSSLVSFFFLGLLN